MNGSSGPPRLALFAPLPPTPSGIADYVVDLLPLLPAEWTIDAFVESPDQVEATRVERLALRELEEARSPGVLDAYDLCVYQIGNGAEHVPVMPLVRERPGLLALHDAVVHPARVHAHLDGGDFHGYRRAAADARPDVGEELAELVATGLWGPSTYWTFPLSEDLVRASRLTVVHGELAAAWLRALVPGAAVETVEHWREVAEVEPERIAGWRARLGAGEGIPLIGTFGHVGPAHGVELLIEAAAALAPRHDFRIVVAGSVDPALDLSGRAERAGIADRLHAPGRLPADDFAALMRAVDLAVNLRYPTARASSGTLQQLLQVGVPSLVHDLVHLRDLPEGAILRVPPGPRAAESAAVTGHLERWLADPARRAEASRVCRRWASARITPEGMADSWVRAVRTALKRPRAA